jgi:hypothetical protein
MSEAKEAGNAAMSSQRSCDGRIEQRSGAHNAGRDGHAGAEPTTVIPGRHAAANPESRSGRKASTKAWIPGSR